jgi:hypothetical protein
MFKKALVTMLAALALGTLSASAAQAVEGVHFKVAGVKLGEGQSKEITSEAGKVTLAYGAGGYTKCSTAVAPGAKIFGSSAGNPGTGELELEFTKCEGNGKHCTFSGSVTTKPLKLTLGAVEGAEFVENHGELAALLKPKSGTEVMRLPPGTCGETLISGELVVRIDLGNDKVGEETPEAKTVELTISGQYKYFDLIEGGLSRDVKYNVWEGSEGLLLGEGSVKLDLASGENWGVFQKH